MLSTLSVLLTPQKDSLSVPVFVRLHEILVPAGPETSQDIYITCQVFKLGDSQHETLRVPTLSLSDQYTVLTPNVRLLHFNIFVELIIRNRT